ncbi:Transposon TX1 uncharacterized protein [Glycine soja]
MHNAKKVRNKIGGSWNYMDNYDRHENGRIWLLWDHREVNLKLIQTDEQFIHVEIYSLDQSLKFVSLVIYAFNQLDRRKELWNKIEDIGRNLNGPWIVIGDFNNDRIGGNNVVETEVMDLKTMMSNMGLFEADMKGNHYTWSNKHVVDVIYSRIDRVIGNVDWFQKYQDASYEVLDPNILDHSPIKIGLQIQKPRRVYLFRFINCISKDPSFMQLVASSWHVESRGTSMEKLWYKLKRLQIVLRPLSRQFTNMQNQIQQVRQELHQCLALLSFKRLAKILLKHKHLDNEGKLELLHMMSNVIEAEDILMQKSKVNWLKLGDNNNAYFHATVKEKNKNKGIYTLTDLDGNLLCTQESIEKEIVSFYKKLVGTKETDLKEIDIPVLRVGKTLSRDLAQQLIRPIDLKEIWNALVNIGETKAPGLDGFTSHFFKAAWPIVKYDVQNAILEFFNTSKLYKAVNCSIVSLIPKSPEAKTIKDMRPISCCSTIYKVISKILTSRLSAIINSVVEDTQSAFIPGRNIQDNILLAQELVRGYGRKNVSPRCLVQMDI